MTHIRMPIASLVGIGLVAGFGIIAVADRSAVGQGQSATPPSAQAARTPYRVGMGEVMVFGIQPRHVKMAIAAQAGDWAYASYAWKELGESFERIPQAIPNYRGKPTASYFDSFMKEPMAAIDQAIKAADITRFKTAYAQLTQGCNGCHQQADRAMVVIKVPDSNAAYGDQDFKPSKP
jgi:hypothetical protein